MPNPDSSALVQTKERPISIWWFLALTVFVLDMLTKQAAEFWLDYASPVGILPMLDFTLLYNKGAAFSFLADQSGWQRWFFTVISLGVSIMLVFWIKSLPRTALWLPTALALVLGGAVGNLVDRIIFGHVIDFISVHWNQSYFPAFNIADSAISIGAAMMIIDVIRDSRRAKTDTE